MAYTTIDKPTDYFNTVLYTGNGSTQSITGVGFQPDWIWIKGRSVVAGNNLHDVVRGVNKQLYTNTADAEETLTTLVTSFDSDGFSLGSNGNANSNTNTFVAWNWLASNTTASNTDGSITTTVSVNQTAGFSIMKYAGNSTNSTIGHGLGASPEFIIFKEIDGAESWRVHSIYTPNNSTNTLALNLNSAAFSQTNWISAISSSTISIGTDSSFNTSGNNYIAYAFAPKKGYSKFGSYTGNGSTNGTFVHTGFRPAFLLIKRTDTTGGWYIIDNKRNTYNPLNLYVQPDSANGDSTFTFFDFYANGFKNRSTGADANASGANVIYMAFAENPFVSSGGIPCTAR